MKRHQKVSAAKIAANKTNAKKSTGPRTAAGKLAASRNAITHGFFSRELPLNPYEKRQLNASGRILHSQLSPQTELQAFAFALIVTCIGRCKVALRKEMGHLIRNRVFGEPSRLQAQHGSEDQVVGTEWYLSGKQALRDGTKLIDAVRTEYERLGRIDPQWHAQLDKAFGSRFRQLITEWPSSDREAVLLAHSLKEHERTYSLPLPSVRGEPTGGKDGKTPEVILDPEQNKWMVLKLLQLQEDVLSDLRKSLEQRATDGPRAQDDTGDFDPRYFPKARRDLERAVEWYLHLQEKDL